MTETQRKRLSGYTALPLALLVCAGAYFGARAIADCQFAKAVESASELEVQTREGLWCYNTLSAREQQLYGVLSDAIVNRDTVTDRVAFVPTQEEFAAAFDAVLYDHPMYCDLLREDCLLVTAEHSAKVTLAYLPDGVARRAVLQTRVDALLGEVSPLDDTLAALQLHDLLAAQVSHPVQVGADALSVGGTAYDALVLGETDAVGYALAYTLLCRNAGIDCAVVTGDVTGGEGAGAHAWNALTLDGITGYTDVMWNDTAHITDGDEEAAQIPFHGYYFLSYSEISADHTADGTFGMQGDTQNYYEQMHRCADSPEALAELLPVLLTDARRSCTDIVEFWLDPQLNLTGYAMEEILSSAISAANADASIHAPRLRDVNRIYHTAVGGGGITVQLFYEETEPLGET